MTPLLVRAAQVVCLGAVPVAVLVLAVSAYAADGRLALDFHEEIYRQADAVVHGIDPYPPARAPITDTTNAVWPMIAVLPAVPLTALPPTGADWIVTLLMLAMLAGALWTLDVRDWRVYGVTLLWPSVIDAYQTANASIPLTLLVAIMWRYRDRRAVAGAALGTALAVKFFLWPIVVWLVATRRFAAAAISALVSVASLFLLIPFISIPDYVRLLRDLSETFDGLSYTPYALLVDLGVSSAAARAFMIALGIGILALAWRRRSLGLAIAAALVLSPIVWRHFFVLLLVPLALSRPRFDVVWLIPIGLWVGTGTFNGEPWQTACVLGLVALTFALCELRPQRKTSEAARVLSPGPAHA